jgi:hypothetical protein
MTTDTPRTEAARFEALRSSALRQDCIPLKLGQELERELAASQAEGERLKKELADWDYGTRAKREQERAEKAEAEAERLDHLLADASETNHKLAAEVLVLKKQVAALRSEKNACLDGNAYYGDKIAILNDRINRVLDILTEQIK